METADIRAVRSVTGSREIRLSVEGLDVWLRIELIGPPYSVTDVLLSPEAVRDLSQYLQEVINNVYA